MKAKFKKGDIVRYVKIRTGVSGPLVDEPYWTKKYAKFMGNLGIVAEVGSGGYSLREIEPLPYVAWYEDEELEYVTNIVELL